jgi:hypothetical protein
MCDLIGSVLKKSIFVASPPIGGTPAREYKFKCVFYKAGMELKREDKYNAHVKQIKNLLENIQLVNSTAIMHATVEMVD